MKKILVTGAGGFIGGHLVKELINRGYQVRATDIKPFDEWYQCLNKVENLELGLKRTKSGVSAGLDGEIKANYTTGKLEKLAGELKSHSYKASPIKKV
jgi:thioester reductase-like protein